MNKWHNVVIDDCCDILDHLRVPVNGQDRQNMKGDIPYYGANGLQGYINDFIFNEDLILIAEDGGNFEEYDTRPIAYKISGKSWVNNHAHILKAKPEYCQDYIFYSLVNKNIVRFIAGGTRSKLNKSELIKIPIYCPQNPVEQQKIAKILSTTDTVIEKTQAAIAKYKAIKQGMLNDLFTRGLDIKTGKLRPKQEDAPQLYKESELLGWIPKEWDVEESNRVVNFINGRAYSIHEWETNGTPVIRLQNLTGSGENYYYSNLVLPESQYCKNGDLLYMWSATFGPHIWKGNKAIYHYHIWKVECSKKINQNYFYYELLRFTETVLNGSNGSTMAHITKLGMDKRLINVPPIQEQEFITNRLLSIDKQLQTEQTYLQKLQQIKSGLMADLLSGNKIVTA